MGYRVLNEGELEGAPFRVQGGRYLLLLQGFSSGINQNVDLQIRAPGAGIWTTALDDNHWLKDNVNLVWMSGGFEYRIVATNTDGFVELGNLHREHYERTIDR